MPKMTMVQFFMRIHNATTEMEVNDVVLCLNCIAFNINEAANNETRTNPLLQLASLQ